MRTRAEDHEPDPAPEERGGRPGDDVEALLGIESADHRQYRTRVGAVESDLAEQLRPTGRLTASVLQRVAGGSRGIRDRVPELGVEAVEDPEESIAPGPQTVVEAHPLRRPEGLGGETRAHRIHEVGTIDRGPEQVEPIAIGARERRAPPDSELGQPIRRRPAVIGEVVDRQEARKPAHDRVVAERAVAEEQRGGSVPIV